MQVNQQDQHTVQVINIPMYGLDIPAATREVIQTCQTAPKTNRTISATGAHGSVFAQKNEEFYQTLQSFTINLPDGQPMVWVGRMKKAHNMKRCYGPDFFETLVRESANTGIKHFFCGGREGVADRLAEVCKTQFGNPNICGTYCPPFLPVEKFDYPTIAKQINASGADVVWIGLSTPKQELFAKRLREYSDVHYIVTVGAAFDFHTGSIRKAPKVISRMGMEWFYRLCQEPKRLYKRYAEIVPMFIYYNLKEFLLGATDRKPVNSK